MMAKKQRDREEVSGHKIHLSKMDPGDLSIQVLPANIRSAIDELVHL